MKQGGSERKCKYYIRIEWLLAGWYEFYISLGLAGFLMYNVKFEQVKFNYL